MKNEKGVTMIALIITITILAIIAFIVLYTARGIDENIDNDMLIQELNQVHHIVLEEYNKKITLGNEYNYINSTSLDTSENNCIEDLSLTGIFYKLTPDNLKSIGAKNATSTYLVCYDTGAVINFTEYRATTDKANFKLYTK